MEISNTCEFTDVETLIFENSPDEDTWIPTRTDIVIDRLVFSGQNCTI